MFSHFFLNPVNYFLFYILLSFFSSFVKDFRDVSSADDSVLVLQVGVRGKDADVLGNSLSCETEVSCDHDDSHSCGVATLDCRRHLRSGWIFECKETCKHEFRRKIDVGLPLGFAIFKYFF